MATLDKLQDLVQFVEKNWFEKTGLITALIGISLTEASLLIAGKAPWWVAIIVLFLSVALVFVIWVISRRLPKTPINKVGFLVSISCDDDAEGKKLREDFLVPLRNLIKSGKAGGAFHFMELPQHLSRKINDSEDALLVRLRSRAHFMLFGRVRLRTIDNQDHHIIDLNGIVAHVPVSDHVSQSIQKEFSELFPRTVKISTENDLFSFQFTSELAAVVAKYIIGIAAGFSGDVDYAEKLYKDVHHQLHNVDSDIPIYQLLIERLPYRFFEIYEARAFFALNCWRIDHDHNYIQELGENLLKLDSLEIQLTGNVFLLKSIYAFLEHRDVDSAIGFLKSNKIADRGIWNFNMAFLFAYKGDLKLSIRHYRHAARFDVRPEVITQVEDFIYWILEDEPEKFQFFYCLGFFNWQVKGDKIQAKKDFTKFINACPNEVFEKEMVLSKKWLLGLE